MTTIIVILIVWWVAVRVIHLIRYLWSAVGAESSPSAELASAA